MIQDDKTTNVKCTSMFYLRQHDASIHYLEFEKTMRQTGKPMQEYLPQAIIQIVHIVNTNSFVDGPSTKMIRALPAEDILVARIMSDAILRKAKIKSQHMDMHCLKKKIASARQPLETIRGKTDGHSKRVRRRA